ncbi:MAG TPA: hypothetical protein VGG89_07275 [Candidatus Baltobacteraceae bacterium]|jgi:hypothetical protein
MSNDQLNIAVSLATLIVVGAASVAAIVQLRHLRTSNQLNAVFEIMNQWNLPGVQAALTELKQIPVKMQDPAYVKMLEAPGSVDRVRYQEFLAFDLWEQIGTFVKRDLVDESTLLDITSMQIVNAWKLAEPAIAVVRARTGPSTFENFEYLAVRATMWNRRYPNGTYPQRLPRMSDL